MDAEGILVAGEHGIHLLFDTSTIGAAFAEDPKALREIVAARRLELRAVLEAILAAPAADQARAFIAELPSELRHVLVMLYFELLDRRLRRRGLALH